MDAFIDRLLPHVPSTFKLPPEIDVVFDIGALNGGYGAGVALYIRRLELKHRLSVRRVSGCSIGAFLAAWYCSGCDEALLRHAEDMFWRYKREVSLAGYAAMMPAFLAQAFPSEAAVTALNHRLFITYYDTKRHRQKTVKRYRNRAHLCECILRSSHIPYVLNGQARRHQHYMDGMVPYLFADQRRPCLFVNMLSWRKVWRVFITRDEVTIYYRLLIGVLDAHRFFVTQQSTDMCSWIHMWPWWYKGWVYSRLFGCLSFLYLCEWAMIMWKLTGGRSEVFHRLWLFLRAQLIT